MAQRMCSKLLALLHFNLQSCMTCNSKTKVLIRLFGILSLLLFAQAVKFGTNSKTLNPCERCRIVVDSFREGLKSTKRGKFEGGDAHWEENKLNNYANSEIRLAEIQESLCHELSTGKDQCHSFAEQYEQELEAWFLYNRKVELESSQEEGSTLFDHLCNDLLKVCCPIGHFGPNCEQCAGYPDDICNNRGYCSGNGTREGKGKCICNQGFAGKTCAKCANNYFATETVQREADDEKVELPVQCEKCDTSCASSCRSAGPRGCHVCRAGYLWDNETGCIDIDECTSLEADPCRDGTYCSNTAGSYKCYNCHKTCKTCTASGARSCIRCAHGYHKAIDGSCAEAGYNWQLISRYLIYVGLISTTFLISRSNFWLGSLLGLLSAIYIGLAELAPDQKPTELID